MAPASEYSNDSDWIGVPASRQVTKLWRQKQKPFFGGRAAAGVALSSHSGLEPRSEGMSMRPVPLSAIGSWRGGWGAARSNSLGHRSRLSRGGWFRRGGMNMRREGDGPWRLAGRAAAVSLMTVLLRSPVDKGTRPQARAWYVAGADYGDIFGHPETGLDNGLDGARGNGIVVTEDAIRKVANPAAVRPAPGSISMTTGASWKRRMRVSRLSRPISTAITSTRPDYDPQRIDLSYYYRSASWPVLAPAGSSGHPVERGMETPVNGAISCRRPEDVDCTSYPFRRCDRRPSF
jgi:hypothetical protein